MAEEFTYFIKLSDENSEQFYLKSLIDEQKNTILIHLTNLKHSWIGTLNQEQVRLLAKKFPSETNDSFYSHTQRAFSKGNKAQIDGRTYVFNCKKLEKNRLQFIWKEKVEALNSLKIIGNIELEEGPNNEILSKMMDYTIAEMEILQTANEQKVSEIQRINHQLTKALETVKRTVDLKEQLESDLYKKFVLVLNAKKTELAKLKSQIEQLTTEENGHQSFAMETDYLSDKRSKHQISHTDTSEDEDIEHDLPTTTQTKLKVVDSNQGSSLDLGNDQIDYKPSTIPKHHQQRKHHAGANTMSTRPILHHASRTSAITTPSLPDDSQTADDLLNKI